MENDSRAVRTEMLHKFLMKGGEEYSGDGKKNNRAMKALGRGVEGKQRTER